MQIHVSTSHFLNYGPTLVDTWVPNHEMGDHRVPPLIINILKKLINLIFSFSCLKDMDSRVIVESASIFIEQKVRSYGANRNFNNTKKNKSSFYKNNPVVFLPLSKWIKTTALIKN